MKQTLVEIDNEAGKAGEACVGLIDKAVDAAVHASGEQRHCYVYVRLVEDDAIHAVNLEQRGVDRPTDVLSFPLSAPGWEEIDPQSGALMLGDILISVPRAQAQAQEYGHSLPREVAYLAAHGTLHLLGYDHIEDDQRRDMRTAEERAMEALGLSREETDAQA